MLCNNDQSQTTGDRRKSPAGPPGEAPLALRRLGRRQQVCDVLFRARALAARGSAVVVVSWQQWQELQGSQQLQARLLEGKLWLLRRQQELVLAGSGADGSKQQQGRPQRGGGGVSLSPGIPVAAAVAAAGAGGGPDGGGGEEAAGAA